MSVSLDEWTNTGHAILGTSEELAQYVHLTSDTHFQVLELCLQQTLPR